MPIRKDISGFLLVSLFSFILGIVADKIVSPASKAPQAKYHATVYGRFGRVSEYAPLIDSSKNLCKESP